MELPEVLRTALPHLRERLGQDALVDGAMIVVARAAIRAESLDLEDAVRAATQVGARLQSASDELWDELVADRRS